MLPVEALFDAIEIDRDFIAGGYKVSTKSGLIPCCYPCQENRKLFGVEIRSHATEIRKLCKGSYIFNQKIHRMELQTIHTLGTPNNIQHLPLVHPVLSIYVHLTVYVICAPVNHVPYAN